MERIDQCTNAKVGKLIALFEFNAADDAELQLIRDHLIECAYCYQQVYSMEPVASILRERTAPVPAAERIAPRRRGLMAMLAGFPWSRPSLVAAFATVVGCFLLAGGYYAIRRGGAPSQPPQVAQASGPWDDLIIPKAPYQRPDGGVALRGPRGGFSRAMEDYKNGKYNEAIGELETLNNLDPEAGAEAKFYLGVSLLLVGRVQESIAPLAQASELRPDEAADSSRYYLALAYLKSNQSQAALRELDTVIALGREHKLPAERLKEQVSNLAK